MNPNPFFEFSIAVLLSYIIVVIAVKVYRYNKSSSRQMEKKVKDVFKRVQRAADQVAKFKSNKECIYSFTFLVLAQKDLKKKGKTKFHRREFVSPKPKNLSETSHAELLNTIDAFCRAQIHVVQCPMYVEHKEGVDGQEHLIWLRVSVDTLESEAKHVAVFFAKGAKKVQPLATAIHDYFNNQYKWKASCSFNETQPVPEESFQVQFL